MILSPPLLAALRNLDRKADGQAVDWINIAAARALTTQGLAVRDREGWRITPSGQAELRRRVRTRTAARSADVVRLFSPP